jgi:hypothetical protein
MKARCDPVAGREALSAHSGACFRFRRRIAQAFRPSPAGLVKPFPLTRGRRGPVAKGRARGNVRHRPLHPLRRFPISVRARPAPFKLYRQVCAGSRPPTARHRVIAFSLSLLRMLDEQFYRDLDER